jgi:hypothetical protein
LRSQHISIEYEQESRSVSHTDSMNSCNMLQGGFGRGLTNADVVNDEAAAATVMVRGAVNGQPFLVERTVRRCRSTDLAFSY